MRENIKDKSGIQALVILPLGADRIPRTNPVQQREEEMSKQTKLNKEDRNFKRSPRDLDDPAEYPYRGMFWSEAYRKRQGNCRTTEVAENHSKVTLSWAEKKARNDTKLSQLRVSSRLSFPLSSRIFSRSPLAAPVLP
jgi:hypothetical protein